MPDFGRIAEQLRRSTVHVLSGNGRSGGNGSGVVWRNDGMIVTNAHVVHDARPRVELWDGRSYSARVVKRDARRDLAELKVDAHGLPAAAVGDASAVRPGELVIAVGNPFGFIGALTTGVVHAVGPLAGLGRRPWVQAAIRLAPGNSGGPLADAMGRVIGLNTMIATGGLALAVPSNAVERFLASEASGRPQLGVTVRPFSLHDGGGIGLMVLDLDPSGAASAASLKAGDVLIGANNRPFSDLDDLADILEENAGRTVVLEFVRGGRPGRRRTVVQLGGPKAEVA